MSELERFWPNAASRWMLSSRLADNTAVESRTRMVTSRDADRWREADDAVLVEAVRGGQTEAFDLLVARHQRTVYQVCYRFVRSHEDASDLTQDVFLRAFRALGSFRGQASFKTWLYRIAVNVGLSRATSKPQETDDSKVSEPSIDPTLDYDEGLDRSRRAVRVRQAVSRLPPKQRTAVVLKIFQDLSHEEAASILGCSVGTVKANVFHALRKLRGWLGDV